MIPEGMSILASALRDVRLLKSKYVYYIPFLDNMRLVIDNNVPTMAMTKTFVCLINEEFYKSLSIDERNEVIMHELMHYYLCHHSRQKSYMDRCDAFTKSMSHEFHNICMDLEINSLIELKSSACVHPGDYGLPEKLGYEKYLTDLLDLLKNESAYVKYHFKYTDEAPSIPLSDYMDILISKGQDADKAIGTLLREQLMEVPYRPDSEANGTFTIDVGSLNFDHVQLNKLRWAMLKSLLGGGGAGGDGSGENCKIEGMPSDLDHRNDNDIDNQSQTEIVNKLKSDSIGNTSGSNSIKQCIRTVNYEWNKILKSIVASVESSIRYGYQYRTFSKPNKRLTDVCIQTGILYPTSYEENYVLNLVIGIDISGSMGDSVELMYRMIKSILNFIPESNLNLTILECDTEVTKRVDNFVINTSLVEVGHGGGTEMDRVISYTLDNKLPFDALIIMTDGLTDWSISVDDFTKSKVHVIVDDDCVDKNYSCPYKVHRASFENLKSK